MLQYGEDFDKMSTRNNGRCYSSCVRVDPLNERLILGANPWPAVNNGQNVRGGCPAVKKNSIKWRRNSRCVHLLMCSSQWLGSRRIPRTVSIASFARRGWYCSHARTLNPSCEARRNFRHLFSKVSIENRAKNSGQTFRHKPRTR